MLHLLKPRAQKSQWSISQSIDESMLVLESYDAESKVKHWKRKDLYKLCSLDLQQKIPSNMYLMIRK